MYNREREGVSSKERATRELAGTLSFFNLTHEKCIAILKELEVDTQDFNLFGEYLNPEQAADKLVDTATKAGKINEKFFEILARHKPPEIANAGDFLRGLKNILVP